MRHGVLFAVLFTTSMAFAQTRSPSAALLDVFPASGAPSFLTTASKRPWRASPRRRAVWGLISR